MTLYASVSTGSAISVMCHWYHVTKEVILPLISIIFT